MVYACLGQATSGRQGLLNEASTALHRINQLGYSELNNQKRNVSHEQKVAQINISQ